ncbi:uncharacterized protein LOC120341228 isoform X1 [Styela clava]
MHSYNYKEDESGDELAGSSESAGCGHVSWQNSLSLQVFRSPDSRTKKGRMSRRRPRDYDPMSPYFPDIKESSGSPRYKSPMKYARNVEFELNEDDISSPSSFSKQIDRATFITAPFDDDISIKRGPFRLPLILSLPHGEKENKSNKRTYDKTRSFRQDRMEVEDLTFSPALKLKNHDFESSELYQNGNEEKRSQFVLLNSGQYSSYLRKVVSRGNFLRKCPEQIAGTSVCSRKNSFPHSSAGLVPCSTEEKEPIGCHVVGDLHGFTTNTMRYFDNPDLSDVILLTGEHRFYAHKFALASQSDVFRDMMIVSDRCTGCPDFQKELELSESKDCQSVFPQFLRFFYCGKITFTSDTALPLLVLAAKYKVEALRSACDAFIANMIEDGDLKSAIKWLKYATNYKLQDLATKCVDGAIADNMEELVDSPGWQSLEPECVEAIMQSSCLLIPDEFFLFEAIQRWFMARRKSASDDEIGEDLRQILPHIRFSQMHGTQLLAVEESPIGLHYRSIIRTYLGDAYRYQILARQCSDFQDPQYLPRDYTDKQWCVCINFHPTRNKRMAPSAQYGNGRWEIQPRRYYDTVNVVIILKRQLQSDVKVCISILIYKRNGEILMRLRRKPCILRPVDMSPRPTIIGGRNSLADVQHITKRSNSSLDGLMTSNTNGNAGRNSQAFHSHSHKAPHGPVNRLQGPHNGQEYYAIDNIVSDADFQMALSQSGPGGIKFGVIIRTWSFSG